MPSLNDTLNKTKPTEIKLDWKAYFDQFCIEHGGDPLDYKGTLLFGDGWRYSSQDYQGPEWPPTPENETYLKRYYWNRRLSLVSSELKDLRLQVLKYQNLQTAKSAILQMTSSYYDEEQQKTVRISGDIDMTQIQGRIAFLEIDVADCKKKLKSLEKNDVNQR